MYNRMALIVKVSILFYIKICHIGGDDSGIIAGEAHHSTTRGPNRSIKAYRRVAQPVVLVNPFGRSVDEFVHPDIDEDAYGYHPDQKA